VKAIRIFFEGSPKLKPGLHVFLSELVLACRERRREIRFVDGGSQSNTIADFKTALKANQADICVLLIDSDGPDSGDGFVSICRRRHLPPDLVFWMVQVMESWFLSDPVKMAEFYGQGFRRNLLKEWVSVESVPVSEVMSILRDATRKAKNGKYHKTKHPPELLKLIRPDLVKKKSAHCRRLFEQVSALLQP
jgi:hypothetical protein